MDSNTAAPPATAANHQHPVYLSVASWNVLARAYAFAHTSVDTVADRHESRQIGYAE